MNASVLRGRYPLAQTGIPKGARGLVIPTSGVGSTPLSFGLKALQGRISYASNLIQRSIPRLTRFLGAPLVKGNPISLNRLQHRTFQTVQSRFNLSTRVLLSRPLRAAGLPRPPTLSRPLQEVGLGTARKFSSQSAFRHVIENTSITTRAFWQADWDTESKSDRRIWYKRAYGKPTSKHHARQSRAQMPLATRPNTLFIDETSYRSDMDDYFVDPAMPTVITFLHIALTANHSFSASSTCHDLYLLPLTAILDQHGRFQDRNKNVDAILAILDSHDAWSNGVSVETLGDVDGLVSGLGVKFSGWDEERVRTLLGNLVDGEECFLSEQVSAKIPSLNASGEIQHIYPEAGHYDLPLEFVLPPTADYEPIIPLPPTSPGFEWDFLETGSSLPSSRTESEWGNVSLSSSLALPHNNAHLALSSAFLTHLDELDTLSAW